MGSIPNSTKPKGQWINSPLLSGAVSAFGAINQGLTNRKNRKWSEQQWDRQNAYNHPVAWRQRMEQAGINPFYTGQSGTAAGSVGSPQTEAAKLDLGAYQTARKLGLERSILAKQADNIQAGTDLKNVQALQAGEYVLTTEQKRKFEAQLFPGQLDAQAADIAATKAGILNKEASTENLRAQTERTKQGTQIDLAQLTLQYRNDSRSERELLNKIADSVTNRDYTNTQKKNVKRMFDILGQELTIKTEEGRRASQGRLSWDNTLVKATQTALEMLLGGEISPDGAVKQIIKTKVSEKGTYTVKYPQKQPKNGGW